MANLGNYGQQLSASTTPPKKSKGGASKMSDSTKEGLAQGGVQAGAGLLTGLASALLMPDEADEVRGNASLPHGTASGISKSSAAQANLSRQSLPDIRSYAANMLGYK
jgi:hypothetical protein